MKFFKCVFFLLCMMLMLSKVNAQQKHFIYIQSADKQPFAVVLSGKVFSSSDYGYVVVPKLADGTYDFTVSFPLNKFPDQKFNCVIDKKDAGFTLQNTGNGWALQNFQTQQAASANANATASTSAPAATNNNAFGNMLSQVANDSSLSKTNAPPPAKVDTPKVVVTENVVPDTNNPVAQNNPVEQSNAPVSTPNTTAGIVASAATASAALHKLSEEKQDTGTKMVFVDNSDTIKVFVPIAADSPITNNSTALNNNTAVQQSEAVNNVVADTSKHDISNPFYNQSTTEKQETVSTPPVTNKATSPLYKPYVPEVKDENAPKPTSAVKSDCGTTITDNDVDKIKRKMFVQKTDYNMVQAAVKTLGDKCITTDQVKTLGGLFTSDDGRYTLYDALYKNVYDYGNYALLETQILDPYYKRRFETMLR